VQVVSGKITPDEALLQFLDQWDTREKDGIVSFDEFVEYYNDVSASIDDDDYFELMMR
jgi:calcyphosin